MIRTRTQKATAHFPIFGTFRVHSLGLGGQSWGRTPRKPEAIIKRAFLCKEIALKKLPLIFRFSERLGYIL